MRAVRDAVIIDKTNLEKQAYQDALAKDLQLVEDAKLLAKLLLPQVATKLERLKQNSLTSAKILTVMTVKPAPIKRRARIDGCSFLFYEVAKRREAAGWLMFVVREEVSSTDTYNGSNSSRMDTWAVWLDSECRIRYTISGLDKDGNPWVSPGKLIKRQKSGSSGPGTGPGKIWGSSYLEIMPGYIKGQAYDFSADIDQLNLATLVRLADALHIVIPAQFRS